MKKPLLIFILLFASVQISNSQNFFENNTIIEEDKGLHFVLGSLSAIPGYYFGWEISNGNRNTAIWTGIAFSAASNLAKELTDGNKSNSKQQGFSTDDFVFGIVGGVASTYVTDLIFQSDGSKKRREELRIETEKKRLDNIYANSETNLK